MPSFSNEIICKPIKRRLMINLPSKYKIKPPFNNDNLIKIILSFNFLSSKGPFQIISGYPAALDTCNKEKTAQL